MIHEQNAVPGMTNRYLAKISQHVLTGFPLPDWANSQYVGNPVRDELFQLASPKDRFKDRNDELRVLVIGGSQGSRFVNTLVPQLIANTDQKSLVWHQTGEKLFSEAEKVGQMLVFNHIG